MLSATANALIAFQVFTIFDNMLYSAWTLQT
jgi:hypothetical protein